MELGNKLLKLRKARGMSQEELAGELGVSRQAVSRWESGETLPDAAKLMKLSDLFGVTADFLLRDEQTDEQQSIQKTDIPPAKIRGRQYWGKVLTIVSLASLLVIFILSTIIKSYAKTTYIHDGHTLHTYGPGFSFWGFINTYNLQVL